MSTKSLGPASKGSGEKMRAKQIYTDQKCRKIALTKYVNTLNLFETMRNIGSVSDFTLLFFPF